MVDGRMKNINESIHGTVVFHEKTVKFSSFHFLDKNSNI